MVAASLPVSLLPVRAKEASIGTLRPPISRVSKVKARWARPPTFLSAWTSVTRPLTLVPAGMAVRPPTTTGASISAATAWPTVAVWLDTGVLRRSSTRVPSGTTSGGAGAGAGAAAGSGDGIAATGSAGAAERVLRCPGS